MTTLNAIADGLWEVPNEVWMPGGVCFEGRMTILALSGGRLLLYSPVPIDDALAAQLAALGEVAHVVAPNLTHHLFAAAAKARYPDATLWAPPGLQEKIGLEADAILGSVFPEPEIQTIPLPSGPHLNEIVLLHTPSRTLVVCDLVFNMRETKGWGTGLLMWMVGCKGKLSTSRSMKYHFAKDDWPQLGGAARSLLELDWDRLVMAHGQIVESGGREALREGIAWLP